MNTKELAKHLGVTIRTIRRWVEKGCPCKKVDDGTLQPKLEFDIKEVAEWRKLQWTKE